MVTFPRFTPGADTASSSAKPAATFPLTLLADTSVLTIGSSAKGVFKIHTHTFEGAPAQRFLEALIDRIADGNRPLSEFPDHQIRAFAYGKQVYLQLFAHDAPLTETTCKAGYTIRLNLDEREIARCVDHALQDLTLKVKHSLPPTPLPEPRDEWVRLDPKDFLG